MPCGLNEVMLEVQISKVIQLLQKIFGIHSNSNIDLIRYTTGFSDIRTFP